MSHNENYTLSANFLLAISYIIIYNKGIRILIYFLTE